MDETGTDHVIDFDPYDANATADDVLATYERMRDTAGVVASRCHGGYDVAARYAEVCAAAADPATFSSAHGLGVVPIGTPRIPPLEFDEPEHRRWLKIMQDPFTLNAVQRQEPAIREIIDSSLDGLDPDAVVDLYSQFAEPIPVQVIGRMVGLGPDSSTRLRQVAMAVFEAFGRPEIGERMAEFKEFTGKELDERRLRPRDDYLTQIASGELNGEHLDDDDAAGVLISLLLGGHHSTTTAMVGLFHHVLTVPGLREQLVAEPDLVPHAIEESLRLTTPLQFFGRTAQGDSTIGEHSIASGRKVLLAYAAANRDERAFAEPDAFDVRRAPNRHLAWGHGIHLCMGRHLARAELRIALNTLLTRFPDARIDGDVVHSGLIGGSMMSILSLPVVLRG